MSVSESLLSLEIPSGKRSLEDAEIPNGKIPKVSNMKFSPMKPQFMSSEEYLTKNTEMDEYNSIIEEDKKNKIEYSNFIKSMIDTIKKHKTIELKPYDLVTNFTDRDTDSLISLILVLLNIKTGENNYNKYGDLYATTCLQYLRNTRNVYSIPQLDNAFYRCISLGFITRMSWFLRNNIEGCSNIQNITIALLEYNLYSMDSAEEKNRNLIDFFKVYYAHFMYKDDSPNVFIEIMDALSTSVDLSNYYDCRHGSPFTDRLYSLYRTSYSIDYGSTFDKIIEHLQKAFSFENMTQYIIKSKLFGHRVFHTELCNYYLFPIKMTMSEYANNNPELESEFY